MKNKLERIVLIDDDKITNMFNTIMLKKSEIAEDIIAFQNGNKALDYLENENVKVDLILLDINMPIINGWQFLDKYQNLNNFNIDEVVVMLLTSSINQNDVVKAKEYPAVKEFINKPLKGDAFKKVMNAII